MILILIVIRSLKNKLLKLNILGKAIRSRMEAWRALNALGFFLELIKF